VPAIRVVDLSSVRRSAPPAVTVGLVLQRRVGVGRQRGARGGRVRRRGRGLRSRRRRWAPCSRCPTRPVPATTDHGEDREREPRQALKKKLAPLGLGPLGGRDLAEGPPLRLGQHALAGPVLDRIAHGGPPLAPRGGSSAVVANVVQSLAAQYRVDLNVRWERRPLIHDRDEEGRRGVGGDGHGLAGRPEAALGGRCRQRGAVAAQPAGAVAYGLIALLGVGLVLAAVFQTYWMLLRPRLTAGPDGVTVVAGRDVVRLPVDADPAVRARDRTASRSSAPTGGAVLSRFPQQRPGGVGHPDRGRLAPPRTWPNGRRGNASRRVGAALRATASRAPPLGGSVTACA
jgi:hypothetical protein